MSTKIILGTMNYGELNPSYLSMGNALNTPVANPFYGSDASTGTTYEEPVGRSSGANTGTTNEGRSSDASTGVANPAVAIAMIAILFILAPQSNFERC